MVKFDSDTESAGFERRGALAALLGTAAVAASAGSAQAASHSNVRKVAPAASPVTATIASPALAGYAYRTVWYCDFLPLDPSSSARTFAGSGGMYAASVLEASIEIPAGATLRDAEWYVANSSGADATFYCAVWTPADGYIATFAPATVPSTGISPTATRVLTTSANWGPYPDGAKIILYAPTASNVLLNGVRLGFTGGGLEANIRTAPLKLYDSATTGGKYAAGETRTVTLAGVPAGTTAVILRVITTGSTAAGSVKVFPANQAEPDVGTGIIAVNAEGITEATIYVIANRQVKIRPSRAANVRLDLVGWYR
ncbi:hypothetical protein IHQ68_16015 [Chelatococcus sambhunathii]|uniref:Uncharacterized protein n=1 Tax=Chelatococcus sambhunathii TaxID=363953 RepID=A0ABU1DJ19_9HYPH|nr:hypothetical protein [Chelatococcus sambhunathii]MDR4308126.1 hypothetical protein [Chelatococcus sambhunathii]